MERFALPTVQVKLVRISVKLYKNLSTWETCDLNVSTDEAHCMVLAQSVQIIFDTKTAITFMFGEIFYVQIRNS